MSATKLLLCIALISGVVIAAPQGRLKSRPAQASAELPEALRSFDKNGNHRIDADELSAVQQAFSALRNLDKNSNGETESAEVTSMARTGTGATARRPRAGEALKRVDKNGNGRIDADEIDGLQQMLAKASPEFMKRIDQNGNGKIEGPEVERLNERIGKTDAAGPAGSASRGASSFRRAPRKVT